VFASLLWLEAWYRASITHASANRASWDVEYEDGFKKIDLCRKCVRPYTPYAVHESLEISVGEHEYATGRVLAVNHLDNTFRIELEDNGQVLSRVQAMDLRRPRGGGVRPKPVQLTQKNTRIVEPVQLTVHARVLAMFPGEGDAWYPGTIAKLNTDGTVDIQYDDGEYAPSVRRLQVDLSQ
jgi:DNA repair protein Crb2 Tudor domain